jgi:hypothetical protein
VNQLLPIKSALFPKEALKTIATSNQISSTLKTCIETSGNQIFGITHNQKVVGIIGENQRETYVSYIECYIFPEHRMNQHGSWAVQEYVSVLFQSGVACVEWVGVSGEAQQAFARAVGFRELRLMEDIVNGTVRFRKSCVDTLLNESCTLDAA